MSPKYARPAVAAALLAFASAACAQVPEALDRASISLGDFFPNVDAKVSAGGPGIAGSNVDFQQDLGLDQRRSLPNFRAELLVFDSQGFSVGGYRYSRHAATSLAREVVFDGNDYAVDAHVQARLRLDTFHAAWHWWFAPDAQDVIGLGLGAAYYDLAGTIEGGVSVNGGSADGRGRAQGDAVAPLLTLGWRHAFSSDFRVYADFSGVRKPSGALTGHLLNGTLGMEYYPWRNVGVALEYSANDLDLKADKASWEGRARIHFHGPAAFVRFRL